MYETNDVILRRVHQLVANKKLNILGKFSVVTMPSAVDNEIADIMQHDVDIQSLFLQVIGGLEPRNIVLITNDRDCAESVADRLMRGIEEAEQVMREYSPIIPKPRKGKMV